VDKLDAIGAILISSSAITAALVAQLQAKKLLTDDEVVAIYEHALLLLEEMRGESAETEVIDAARTIIEEQLRGLA
jgi:hypothetical protein